MQKQNLAAQPVVKGPPEYAAGNPAAEVQGPEKWVQQEEHKLQNARVEWEHPQDRAQRPVPGLDLKRMFL